MKTFLKILLFMFLAVLAVPLTVISIVFIAKFYAFMLGIGLVLIPLAIPITVTALIYYWLYKLVKSFENQPA